MTGPVQKPVFTDNDNLFMGFINEYSIQLWTDADQYDPSNHVEDCGCDDWRDGDIDAACIERVPWRLAVTLDGGAHPDQFVCWADKTTSEQILERAGHNASDEGDEL